MEKARLTFKFCETEEQAQKLCAWKNSGASRSRYMIKKYPAHYMPWESRDGSDSAHWIALWHES